MRVLVDSNVIIDLLTADPRWGDWSRRRVLAGSRDDEFVVNVIVLAEIAHSYLGQTKVETVLDGALFDFEDIPRRAGFRAGIAHRDHRVQGVTRERTLPDFLIGAHAEVAGHRLLTRDPGRYRSYFPTVDIIAPDTHP